MLRALMLRKRIDSKKSELDAMREKDAEFQSRELRQPRPKRKRMPLVRRLTLLKRKKPNTKTAKMPFPARLKVSKTSWPKSSGTSPYPSPHSPNPKTT